MPRRAVILAGGLGTRVRHILPGIPKPMAVVARRPFLEWVIRFLVRQGIKKIRVSTGYMADVISQFVKQIRIAEIDIRCVSEGTALGTAGGFLNAIQGEAKEEIPWLVCNGDSLVLANFDLLYSAFDDATVEAAVLGVRMKDTSRYGGLQVDREGRLKGFSEKRSGSGLINAGVYLLRGNLPAKFPSYRPLSFEMDVFPYLLAENSKIHVCSVDAAFLDIGTEETLRQADDFISTHRELFV